MTFTDAFKLAIDMHGSITREHDKWAQDIARYVAVAMLKEAASEREAKHANGNYKYDTRHECTDAIKAMIQQVQGEDNG